MASPSGADEVEGSSDSQSSDAPSTDSSSHDSESNDSESNDAESNDGLQESESGDSESSSSEGESTDETAAGALELVTVTLAYGPAPDQDLDLILPQPPARAALPVVVLAHGGLWQAGSKQSLAPTCANLVLGSEGALACASIGYRLSDALGGACMAGPPTYEDQLRDFGAALTLVQTQAEQYGLDPTQVFVGGHSAGGHLALSLALRWDTFTGPCAGEPCPAPIGAIGIEGIYDVAAWDAYDQSYWNGTFACATRKAFGDPPGSPSACLDAGFAQPCWSIGSPTYLANHAAELGITTSTHALLVHSPDDAWVDPAEATTLGAALASAFAANSTFVAIDGSCGVGSHDAVLIDPALTECTLAFVASQGTSIAP